MARTFSVTIEETSRELSAKERIQIKDSTDAVKLDKVLTYDNDLVIDVDMYAVLEIHNEKSETPDYESYVIVDKNGTRYTTASPSFWNSFMDIWEELKDEPDWKLKVYKMPSRNRDGKAFITCSVL